MKPLPEYYLVEELATKLRVNPMTIYRWIKSGRMAAVKLGKEYRIDRVEFERLVTQATSKSRSSK